ncbi:hypothetical protein BDW74DRAFT_184294 [Aspergillus multicolor]|uniref:5'-methylthioadenosine/S-adenosylhomocysteine nucleosidase family protein n=1 Tax=Aspergillus multicolor TaxID=41759 RepID=UPI003CCE4842
MDVVGLVADVAVELGGSLRDCPPLYRRLKRPLAILVAELKDNALIQQSDSSTLGSKAKALFQTVAKAMNHALRDDLVKTKYDELMAKETPAPSRRLYLSIFQPWAALSPRKTDATCRRDDSPYPILKMTHELINSHHGGKLCLNQLVDQVYEGTINAFEDNHDSTNQHQLFIIESAFCGKASIRHLARTLYDVLHANWPCLDEHEHTGRLGHCVEAKFRLDPDWSARVPDPTNNDFFLLLTGSDMIQECRICLCSSLHRESTMACLVDHEESRSVCLQLRRDEHDRLWGSDLGQPPEAIEPDVEYIEQSLGKLLHLVKPTYAAKRVLGVVLARSVLHLLDGPWIPRTFGIDDISLFCRLEKERPFPLFNKVFVSTRFEAGAAPPTSKTGGYSVHPFPTILALAIVLMEIELGDDLAELYTQPEFATLKRRHFELAKRLLRECQMRFHESGLLRAINFCIDRNAFLPFANTKIDLLFDNQDFVTTFYAKAVRPLEDDLIQGAKWTWDEVRWLQREGFDEEGVCKIINKLGSEELTCGQHHEHGSEHVQRSTLSALEVISETNVLGRATQSTLMGAIPFSHEQPNPTPHPSLTRHASLASGITSVSTASTVPEKTDFEIAIICALPPEANAVLSIFDEIWDDDPSLWGKDPTDPISYTLGVIARRNVVLAHQPRMGKVASATLAAYCASSFTNVKLALVVGICGVVPFKKNGEEILLGDVIISDGVVQYDLERQFSDGFKRKIDVQHSLGRPNARILSTLAKLETRKHGLMLESQILGHLEINNVHESAPYPGDDEDRLYASNYQHKHQHARDCSVCAKWNQHTSSLCSVSREATCEDLGCDSAQLVQRDRRNQTNSPKVHIGLFASGDSVVKSAIHRDGISKDTNVIAFEMEGAGVWDAIPCVIIKGACDYADSHKNKLWQEYAAATAAACAKAFVRQW